jgi:hypothetical protein
MKPKGEVSLIMTPANEGSVSFYHFWSHTVGEQGTNPWKSSMAVWEWRSEALRWREPHSHEQDWITVETSPFFIEPDFGEKLVLTPAYSNDLGEYV